MRNVATLIFSFFVVAAVGQNKSLEDYLFKDQFIDCRDLDYNAFSVINQLYARNQYDSINLFLDYWNSKCGVTEQQFRLTRILDIRSGRFNQDHVIREWFDYLIQYKALQFEGYGNENIHDIIVNQMKLDLLIQKIASEIQPPENTDAKLMLDFYSTNSPSFERIKNTSPEESKFSGFYQIESDVVEKMTEVNLAAFIGYIRPNGNMSILGPHLTIGAMAGLKKLRHSVDFVAETRTGSAASAYTIQYKDTLLKIKDFRGFYGGLEYGYELLKGKKIVLSASSGVGFEELTSLFKDSEFDDESKTLYTFNVNGGLALRWFVKEGSYIGIQARYNLVNFSNTGGTDMSGDYFSLRLLYGSTKISDKYRRKRLLE